MWRGRHLLKSLKRHHEMATKAPDCKAIGALFDRMTPPWSESGG
jgi:hypothetical protein